MTAGIAGGVLLAAALLIVLVPPGHRVALQQCSSAAAGCVVTVDGDVTTFAAVLAAIGAAALLIGLLGVRFNRVKAGGTELGWERETQGLAQAEPAAEGTVNPAAVTPIERSPESLPVRVDVVEEPGERLQNVPVAVTHLTSPMRSVDPLVLRDYQLARRRSQRMHFLTHILGPATQPGQKYSVAIRVTPHRNATDRVRSASFYFGPSWGNRIFEGRRGPDGRFGVATEAYGPFTALCEIEFEDGSRIVLDHYCDFDMGALLPAS
jgi:hypothetical protein